MPYREKYDEENEAWKGKPAWREFTLRYYRLDAAGDHERCTMMEWAKWLEAGNNQIASDYVWDQVNVSTIFLGLDHGFGLDDGLPILWETMVFGPSDNRLYDVQRRYTSKAAALKGHAETIAEVLRLRPRPWKKRRRG